MCPEHEMEKVNMYCEVCRRPVCHLCKLGGSHANHKVTSMSNAYKILKVTLDPSSTDRRLCRERVKFNRYMNSLFSLLFSTFNVVDQNQPDRQTETSESHSLIKRRR